MLSRFQDLLYHFTVEHKNIMILCNTYVELPASFVNFICFSNVNDFILHCVYAYKICRE